MPLRINEVVGDIIDCRKHFYCRGISLETQDKVIKNLQTIIPQAKVIESPTEWKELEAKNDIIFVKNADAVLNETLDDSFFKSVDVDGKHSCFIFFFNSEIKDVVIKNKWHKLLQKPYWYKLSEKDLNSLAAENLGSILNNGESCIDNTKTPLYPEIVAFLVSVTVFLLFAISFFVLSFMAYSMKTKWWVIFSVILAVPSVLFGRNALTDCKGLYNILVAYRKR